MCAGESFDRDDDENDDEAGGPRNTAWIRQGHDAEGLPGRGVKCWVRPEVALVAVGPQPSNVRVLVGNRALMADEGVPVSRHALFILNPLHPIHILTLESNTYPTCILILKVMRYLCIYTYIYAQHNFTPFLPDVLL